MSSRSSAGCVAASLACAVLGLARPAHAWHTSDERPTDHTAYTLPQGKVRVGLLDVDWGVIDQLMLSTYHPYLTVAFGNAGAKWRIYQGDVFAMSLRAHAFYLNAAVFQLFEDESASFDIAAVPVESTISLRLHEKFTWSFAHALTTVKVTGSFNEDDFRGAAAVTNLQVHTNLEYRVNELVALSVRGRYLVFQTAKAAANVTLRPDDFTTVEAAAAGGTDALDFPNVFSVLPAIHFSWRMFNLRTGVGYGSFNIPGINFMLPARTFLPELDMFWVF